jgi:3-dehydroquinate synthase
MNAMTSLTVPLGARSYPIHIGEGLLAQSGALLAPLLPQRRAFLIADAHTAPLYAARVRDSLLASGIASDLVALPAGEETKSFAQFGQLMERLLALRPERSTGLIALGGGVIGDLTGFAASVLLRGVPFVQIPTTLLAQVDSSVGGKTAINSTHGKNLIGTFYQPLAVFADTETLRTLPPRQLRAGYAEVLKYGLLGDRAFFDWLETHGAAVLRGDPAALTHAVETSCRAKAAIVGADERESADRALLNLGHTFGHALEKAAGYGDALLHGEAVALGCLMAFELSARMGLCPAEDLAAVRNHLERLELLVKPSFPCDPAALTSSCYQDKKVSGGTLTFVLAHGIGKAFVSREIKAAEVEEVFRATLA